VRVLSGHRPEPVHDSAERARHLPAELVDEVRCVQKQVSPHRLDPGDGQRTGPPQSSLDALEAVGRRINLLSRGEQRPAEDSLLLIERAHTSRSRTSRSACMARAV
jgi:hypothetical protein